jgi:hypothetical protein
MRTYRPRQRKGKQLASGLILGRTRPDNSAREPSTPQDELITYSGDGHIMRPSPPQDSAKCRAVSPVAGAGEREDLAEFYADPSRAALPVASNDHLLLRKRPHRAFDSKASRLLRGPAHSAIGKVCHKG